MAYDDIQKNSIIKVSTTTGISTKSTGATSLYVVPASKSFVVMYAVVRCVTADTVGTSAVFSIGTNATDYNDIFTLGPPLALNDVNKFYVCLHKPDGVAPVAVATTDIKFNVSSAISGTSQTVAVDLFGYFV